MKFNKQLGYCFFLGEGACFGEQHNIWNYKMGITLPLNYLKQLTFQVTCSIFWGILSNAKEENTLCIIGVWCFCMAFVHFSSKKSRFSMWYLTARYSQACLYMICEDRPRCFEKWVYTCSKACSKYWRTCSLQLPLSTSLVITCSINTKKLIMINHNHTEKYNSCCRDYTLIS